MILKSINEKQRLYVIAADAGFTCYGFEVLDRKAKAIREWLLSNTRATRWGLGPLPTVQGTIGTGEHFAACAELLIRGQEFARVSGERCSADLTPQLIGLEGQRVEVAMPGGETSRFYVGKSTGWLPCHLELKTKRLTGGVAVYLPEGSTVRVIR